MIRTPLVFSVTRMSPFGIGSIEKGSGSKSSAIISKLKSCKEVSKTSSGKVKSVS